MGIFSSLPSCLISGWRYIGFCWCTELLFIADLRLPSGRIIVPDYVNREVIPQTTSQSSFRLNHRKNNNDPQSYMDKTSAGRQGIHSNQSRQDLDCTFNMDQASRAKLSSHPNQTLAFETLIQCQLDKEVPLRNGNDLHLDNQSIDDLGAKYTKGHWTLYKCACCPSKHCSHGTQGAHKSGHFPHTTAPPSEEGHRNVQVKIKDKRYEK